MECPACRHLMQQIQVGRIALDRCPGCGVLWFDEHELRQFLALVKRAPVGAEVAAPAKPPTEAAACPRCRAERAGACGSRVGGLVSALEVMQVWCSWRAVARR